MNTKKITNNIALSLLVGTLLITPAFAESDNSVSTDLHANTNIQVGLNDSQREGQGRPGMMTQGVYGTVTAISGNTITISGKGRATGNTVTTFTIDATNAKIDKARAASTISNIAVGDTLLAEGTVSGTNVTAVVIHDGIMAKRNPENDRTNSPEHRPVVIGTVSAISGSTITITTPAHGKDVAKTLTVNTSTATIVEKNNTTASLSGIAVGDTLVVEGTLSGTTITATAIHDGAFMKNDENNNDNQTAFEGDGQPVLAGTISAINGSTITIKNKSNISYTVDVTNTKISKAGITHATNANFVVGDTILAQGAVNGTTLTATNILDQGLKTNDETAVHAGFFTKIGNFFSHFFFGAK